MVLRYEDLLLEVDQTLAGIADLIGYREIAVPDVMNDYGREWQDNSSFGDLTGVLDPAPIGRWRQQDPDMGRVVEALLQDSMESAGYEVLMPLSKRTRISAQLHRIAYLMLHRLCGV
jgi:hypothetical protein